MLFTGTMRRKINYGLAALAIVVFIAWLGSSSDETEKEFSESVKIALREVGHQLLLANQDSTSLVLPIIDLEASTYQLSFQKELSIAPDSLVAIIKRTIQKATLSEFYIVEVVQCVDKEVAYSFSVMKENDKSIIPCQGRNLPETCYTIKVRFIKGATSFFNKQTLLYLLITIVFLLFISIFYNRKSPATSKEILATKQTDPPTFARLGSFKFYATQNKLVKEAVEISLSKKECELLAIFVAHPNQIIKRDELTKRVWEDHGVFVGRSLDTYISKLRKKLKDDESIKITNVHGVGYKLEIKSK